MENNIWKTVLSSFDWVKLFLFWITNNGVKLYQNSFNAFDLASSQSNPDYKNLNSEEEGNIDIQETERTHSAYHLANCMPLCTNAINIKI